MEEVWKKHPVYVNYEGSNLGNVRSLNYKHTGKPRELKVTIQNGYGHFNIRFEGRTVVCYLHSFVWECFNGPKPQGMQIDHILPVSMGGGNELSNLRLCTPKENCNNPHTRNNRNNIFSCSLNRADLSKTVIQYTKDGKFVREWSSTNEIERELGFYCSSISECCNQKPNHKSAYGFIWRYS